MNLVTHRIPFDESNADKILSRPRCVPYHCRFSKAMAARRDFGFDHHQSKNGIQGISEGDWRSFASETGLPRSVVPIVSFL